MKQYYFNSREQTDNCISWIRNWFTAKAAGMKAVVLMDNGIDSIVTAMLCVKALGRENVIGVVVARDKTESKEYDEVFNYFGIKKMIFRIKWLKWIMQYFFKRKGLNGAFDIEFDGLLTNLVAKCNNGIIVSSRTATDIFTGWPFMFGNPDGINMVLPLKNFTETEVKMMRKSLCIPSAWCAVDNDIITMFNSDYVATIDHIIRYGWEDFSKYNPHYDQIRSEHFRKRFNYKRALANFDGYEWNPYKEITVENPSTGKLADDYIVDDGHYGGWKGLNETY